MNDTVLNVVASIEKGDFKSAFKILDNVKAEEKLPVYAYTIDLIAIKMYDLRKQVENMRAQLAMHEELEDTFSSSFITSVCSSITDYQSALKAKYLYSSAWFRDLEFSLPVKISFAQRLIDTVAPFNPSYVSGLWVNVVNGVPEALDAIAFDTSVKSEDS